MRNKYQQVWFDRAEDNLKWARDNLKLGNNSLACFLSQQAAELVLKGFLYVNDEVAPKTHNLVTLAKHAKKYGLDLDEFIGILKKLTEYYIESRYSEMVNTELEKKGVAEKALASAEKIVKEISQKLQK